MDGVPSSPDNGNNDNFIELFDFLSSPKKKARNSNSNTMNDEQMDVLTVMHNATSSFDPSTITDILFGNPYHNEASEET